MKYSSNWRDRRSGGFSIVELLIVIVLISILSTIGLSSYSAAQKRGRDTKRKSDLKEIQSSLEQYFTVCDYLYPGPIGAGSYKYYQAINCLNPEITIMPKVPKNPRSTPYYCDPCSDTQFKICTSLEAETDDFCVTNSQ